MMIEDVIIGEIKETPLRRKLAQTFDGFCVAYLSHYLTLPKADYHPQLLSALGMHAYKQLLIIGHRGSAKSTFASMALPLWMALEHPKKYQFIILIGDTTTQSDLMIANLKNELENNTFLKRDYGIDTKYTIDADGKETEESDKQWQAKNLVLFNGVRILARSRGQKIRGLRHGPHRPKAVIGDDLEDLEWVNTKENRDKSERWLRNEVMGALDERSGRLILIGNWLHEDALLARVKANKRFKVLEFPLVTDEGKCQWPAKYPTKQSLIDKETDMGAVAFAREMLLKIIPDEGRDVIPEDISYYDDLPMQTEESNDMNAQYKVGQMRIEYGILGHGVDFAISQKASADKTTRVSGRVIYVSYMQESGQFSDPVPRLFVLPNPLNEQLTFTQTMDSMAETNRMHEGQGIFFPEDVAYQKAAVEMMIRQGLPVHAMKTTKDKRSRLRVGATYIKNGIVVFPRYGCETLLQQLFGFGVEKHDDLMDGLLNLIFGIMEEGIELPKILMFDMNPVDKETDE